MIAYAHFNKHSIAYRNKMRPKESDGQTWEFNFSASAAQIPGKRFFTNRHRREVKLFSIHDCCTKQSTNFHAEKR